MHCLSKINFSHCHLILMPWLPLIYLQLTRLSQKWYESAASLLARDRGITTVTNQHTSTGIDADASKGETRSGYFDSKLVQLYKCGILVPAVLFVTVIMTMLCIFPKKIGIYAARVLPTHMRECNRQYLINSLGLVGNIYIGKSCIIGVYTVFHPFDAQLLSILNPEYNLQPYIDEVWI